LYGRALVSLAVALLVLLAGRLLFLRAQYRFAEEL
jgi:hypothetical protein